LEVVEGEPERGLELGAPVHLPCVVLDEGRVEVVVLDGFDLAGFVVVVETGAVIGGGLDELPGWGPRTQTITAVNTMIAADAATAMTTSRRSRGAW